MFHILRRDACVNFRIIKIFRAVKIIRAHAVARSFKAVEFAQAPSGNGFFEPREKRPVNAGFQNARRFRQNLPQNAPGVFAVAGQLQKRHALHALVVDGKVRVDDVLVIELLIELRRFTDEHLARKLADEIHAHRVRAATCVRAAEADGKGRHGDFHLLFNRSDRNLLGLGRTTAPLELRLFSRRGQPARLLDDGGRVHVADDADDEVRGIVERVVAELQSIGRDLLDALDRACNVIAHRVVLIHDAEQIFHHGRVRAVLVHFDFLRDDAALFLDALVGKIPGRDHAKEDLEILFQMLRTLDVVGCHGVACKGVVRTGVFGELLHGVSFGEVKHLVLQIVRHALRRRVFLAIQEEFRVDRAVVCRDERVPLGKARLFHDADKKAVREPFFKIVLAEFREVLSYHAVTPSSA